MWIAQANLLVIDLIVVATKSRLGKIVGTAAYKSMTIRSWATTMALLERMEASER
jgi:uncharacterized protein (DUF1697 family)